MLHASKMFQTGSDRLLMQVVALQLESFGTHAPTFA
jgi:hypothetical protein